MFNLRGDPDPRNNQPGLPVLDILMSIPFLIGLGVTLWRWRRPAFGVTLLAGAIMLVPTVLSEYAPHFRRAVGAAPIVALLCGLGLAILLGQRRADLTTRPEDVPARLREDGVAPEQIAAGMDRLRGAGRVIIVGAILLGSTAYTISAYFMRWGPSNAVYYAYDQGLWEIGQYVLGLPADEAVYVTPRPATDMTLAFAWREGRPVRHFDGRHAFVAAAADRPTNYIVIEHEDFRGGQLLQSLYPDAVETHIFRDRAGQVYARAFRVTPGAVAARQPKYQARGSWPGVDLVGFDLDHADGVYKPGDIVYLQLWWRATGESGQGLDRLHASVGTGQARWQPGVGRAGCAAGAGQRAHHNLDARRPDPGRVSASTAA